MPWNDNLENSSLRIAASQASPLRVLAGPGTGKTFTLIRRIARFLEEGVVPRNILFCTFTRTAADDLKRELNNLNTDGASLVCATTVHALCFSILAQNAVLIMTGRVPRPLLEYEKRFLCEDLNNRKFGNIRDIEKRLKAFEAAWARLQSEEPGWPDDSTDKEFHRQLLSWLRFHDAMLVGELIPETLRYLQGNPDNRKGRTFSHILVDEYQDLNVAEQELIELISKNAQLTIVGDEDQSIYGFKHAHPEGITKFHKRHPKTVAETLDLCRRCPTKIVDIANHLISKNQRRLPRALVNHPPNGPGEVSIVQWENMEREAEGLAKFIHRRVQSGHVAPAKILVLAPRRKFGYGICGSLQRKGVPACSFFGEEVLDGNPKKLLECKVQLAFTLLTLIVNPEDKVALRCWCGFGSPDLRRGAWQRVRDLTAQNNASLADVLRDIENGQYANPHNRHLIARLRELRIHLNGLATRGRNAGTLLDALFPDNDPDFAKIRAMVAEFDPNADAEHLFNFLRTNIAQPEPPLDGDSVRVMSLHKSKGLTADLVVVMGCIEQLIPARHFSEEELEEQRRLFYVSITRAHKTLVLSGIGYLPLSDALQMGFHVQQRGGLVTTNMSRFIRELELPRSKCDPLS